MPYSAQRQSLFGNVGGPVQSRPPLDIGGAIQELGGVASSLIHQHYLREASKRAQEQAYARQQQEDEYRRQDREDRQQERQDRLGYENRRLELDALSKGVTFGTEGGATVQEEAPTPSIDAPATSLKGAMLQGMRGPAGAPAPTSPLTKPVTPGSLGTVPNVSIGEEAPTPTTYDPSRDVTLQRQTTLQDSKAKTQLLLSDRMSERAKAVAQIHAGAQVKSAQVRTSVKGGNASGGALHREMSGNAKEQRFQKVDAPGLLEDADWDLPTAIEAFRNTPGGRELAAQGFTERHLSAAFAAHNAALEAHAMKLEGGATGLSPTEAATAVDSTRKLVRGKRGTTPAPAAAAPKPTPPYVDPAQAEYDRATANYQKLLSASGKTDDPEAKAAYDAAIAKIAKRYGQVK